MKKKVLSITLVAAILIGILSMGVLTVSAAEGVIKKNRVTFSQSGTDTDNLPAGTDKAAYIAGKKSAFENRVNQIAGANGDIDDYSALFTENTYAVVKSVGWGGVSTQESDDLVYVGDLDDLDNIWIISGWIAKVTTYVVNYDLVTVSGDAPAAAMIGDLNGDKVIDVLDATVVQKAVVEKLTLTPEQQAVADVNDDKTVDVLDSVDIQKFVVERITEFKKKA